MLRRFPAAQLPVGALGGLEGVVARDGDHGGQLAVVVGAGLAGQLEGRHVQLLGAIEVGLGQLHGGDGAVGEESACSRTVRKKVDSCMAQPLQKTRRGGSSGSSGKSRSVCCTSTMPAMAAFSRSSSAASS